MAEFEYSPQKMHAAIQFFCRNIKNQSLGRTKLAKLLYYVDFDHFEQYDRPVTGATYKHYPMGPYPQEMMSEIKQLRNTGQLEETEQASGPYPQYLYTVPPDATVDLGIFETSELQTLIDVANKWQQLSATELVAATHGEAPWIATEDRKVIPYEYAYYRHKFEPVPDDEDREGETIPLVSL